MHSTSDNYLKLILMAQSFLEGFAWGAGVTVTWGSTFTGNYKWKVILGRRESPIFGEIPPPPKENGALGNYFRYKNCSMPGNFHLTPCMTYLFIYKLYLLILFVSI